MTTPEITSLSRSKRRMAALALLLLAGLLIYGHALDSEFLSWDDDIHITENPHLNPVSIKGVLHFWRHPYEGLYLPMSYTFFAAETFVADRWFSSPRQSGNGADRLLNPQVFHVVSLMLHLFNAGLLLLLLEKLFGRLWPAVCGAALFVVHPLQVESVAWISETRGLLATAFSLTAIWFYLKFAELRAVTQDSAPDTPTGRRSVPTFLSAVLATLAFLLALLSKPTAAVIPAVAYLICRLFIQRRDRAANGLLLLWVAFALAMTLITQQEQSRLLFTAPPAWMRPLIAGDALAFYLQKLVAPWPLAFDYGRTPAAVTQSWSIYWAWLIPAGVGAGVWLTRRNREIHTAAAIFLVGLLPVLGLVPFAFQYISTVADRYVYLSMIGPALALASLVSRISSRWCHWAVTAVLLILGCLSHFQAFHWNSDGALYAHALEVNPQSFVARNGLGRNFLNQHAVDRAIAEFRQAVADNPGYATGHHNLGVSLLQKGLTDEAATHFRKAISLDPARWESHFELARILEQQSKISDAADYYRAALRANPQHVQTLNNLASLAFAQGAGSEALPLLRTAVSIAPDFHQARINLGHVLLSLGRTDEAVEQYEFVLKADPLNPDVNLNLGLISARRNRLPEALVFLQNANRGVLEGSSSNIKTQIRYELAATHNALGIIEHAQKQFDAAITHYTAALKYHRDFVPALYNLSESLYERGDVQRALEKLQAALELVEPDSAPADDIRARIREYSETQSVDSP